MNKVYRVVWNASLGVWVAVSELAKSKTKTKSVKTVVVGFTLTSLSSMAIAAAGIAGEQVENTYFHVNNGTNAGTGNATTNLGKITDAAGAGATGAVTAGIDTVANTANSVAIGQAAKAGGSENFSNWANLIHPATGAKFASEQELRDYFAANQDPNNRVYRAVVGKMSNVAIGHGAVAEGGRNISIGEFAGRGTADNWNIHNVNIGSEAGQNSKKDYSVAIGYRAGALTEAQQLTQEATLDGARHPSILIGKQAGEGSVAYGTVAMGAEAGKDISDVRSIHNIAIGRNAGQGVSSNDGINATFKTFGSGANTLMGASAGRNLSGDGNVAIGNLTGRGTTGDNNIMMGHLAGSDSATDRSIIMGNQTGWETGTNDRNVLIGNFVNGGQKDNVAKAVGIGNNTIATGNSSVSIGDVAQAKAVNAIAIGTGAQATGKQSISVGTGNVVSGDNSGAFGDPTTISGTGSYSVGNNNTIATNDTFVVGSNVTKTLDNSVFLGKDAAYTAKGASTDGIGAVTEPVTVGGTLTYGDFAGKTPVGVVSVGDVGEERRIQNMAAGKVAATSTDAINGSQLYAVASKLGEQVENTYFHVNNGTNAGTGNATTNLGKITDAAGAGATGAVTAGIKTVANTTNSVAIGQEAKAGGSENFSNWANLIHPATGAKFASEQELRDYFAANQDPNNRVYRAVVGKMSNVAIGHGAVAEGGRNISIGEFAGRGTADNWNIHNVNIGSEAGQNSKKDYSVAIGYRAGALTEAQQLTQEATLDGARHPSILIGKQAGEGSVAYGTVAMGAEAGKDISDVRSIHNIAIGRNAGQGVSSNDGINATFKTFGSGANTLMGASAGRNLSGDGNVAIGNLTGRGTTGDNNIMMGHLAGSDSATDRSIIMGNQTGWETGTNDRNVLIGNFVNGGQKDNVAKAVGIGNNTIATGNSSVSIGDVAQAKAVNAIAIGTGAQATGKQSISVGTGNVVSGDNSGAFGDPTTISGTGSYSVGNNNTIATNDTFVVGSNVTKTLDNSVFLGKDAAYTAKGASTDGIGAVTEPVTVGGTLTYGDFAGKTPVGVVSVGDVGEERRIQNMAAGKVAATSTDAINGSQLYATNAKLGNVANTVVENFGGNATLNADGNITYTNIGNTGKDNIHDAIQAATTEVAAGTNVVDVKTSTGDNDQTIYTVNAKGTTATAGSDAITVEGTTDNTTNITDYVVDLSDDTKSSLEDADSALQTVVTQIDGTDVKSISKDDNTANFVTGDNIVLEDDGNGGIKVSTDENVTFTNVTSETMVVNNGDSISQGGDVNYITEGNTSVVNGGDVYTAINSTEQQYTADNGEIVTRNPNEVLTVKGGAATSTENNILTEANVDGSIAVKLAETIDLGEYGSVTMGDTTVNNAGLTIAGGPSITNTGIDAGNTTITNVAPGVNGTDAVNVDQLTDVSDVANAGWNVQTNGDTATKVAPGDTVQFIDGKNIDITRTGSDITVATSDIVEFTDATVTNNLTTNNFTATGDTKLGDNFYVDNSGAHYDGDITEGDHIVNKNYVDNSVTELGNKGFNIAADNGTDDNVKLGETVTYTSEDESIVTTVTDNTIDFALGNNLNVGGPGKDGADGVDGTIGVNGKDGTSGVTINGADGSIGLTGPAGPNGEPGANGTISVKNGVPGVDGQDGITRIVIDDIEVATMEDGLNFAGNTGDTIAKKLNEKLTVKGELADTEDASGANLRVDSKDGNLNLVMARDLTDLNSITINDGGPIISRTGIDMGGNRITNLAPGVDGTDAVNMDQLDELSGNVNQGLNFTGDDALAVVNRKPGDTLSIVGGISKPSMLTDGNIGVVVNNNQLEVKLAEDINLGSNGSVMLGDTFVNRDGLTITGGPSVTKTGINAGNKKITGVAKGEISQTSTDAVNGSQLWEVKNDIDKDVAASKTEVQEGKNITVTETKGADGQTIYEVSTSDEVEFDKVDVGSVSIDKNKVDKDGNTIISGVGAGKADTDAVNVGQLKDVVAGANKGFNVTAQGKNESNVANGGSIDFNNTDGNIKVEKATDSNDISFNLNPNLNLGEKGSITTGDTKVNNSGVTTGNTSMTNNGIIINNAKPDSKDYDENKTVSVTDKGLNNGGNRITNVGPGVDGTDAVNINQLKDFGYNLSNKIDKVGDEANAGVSSAMAMAALPQAYIPGKSMVTGGVATYNGQGAVAVGVSKLSDNGRWVIKISGSADTEGNAGGAVGAGFHF